MRRSMFAQLLVALVCVGAARDVEAGGGFARSLDQLVNHRIVSLDVVKGAPGRELPNQATGPLEIEFYAYGKQFHLGLFPVELFEESNTEAYIVRKRITHQVPAKNFSYRGAVRDDPGSWVRVTLSKGALTGRVVAGDGTNYLLRPHRSFDELAAGGEVVVFRAAENAERPYRCGVDDLERTEAASLSAPASTAIVGEEFAPAARPYLQNGDLERLDVGLLSDWEFGSVVHGTTLKCITSSGGGSGDACTNNSDCSGSETCEETVDEDDVMADMQAALNDMDGQYRNTLGQTVTLRAPVQVVLADKESSDTELGPCARICIKDAGLSTEALPNFTGCTSDSDCATGETCEVIPRRFGTCDDNTDDPLPGRACLHNSDCPNGACDETGPERIDSMLCLTGAEDGMPCQITNCDDYGNCCSSNKCNVPSGWTLGHAGDYRKDPNTPITTSNTGIVHLYTSCETYVDGLAGADNGDACDTTPTALKRGASMQELVVEAGDSVTPSLHEIGHNLAAKHDDKIIVATQERACGDLWIPRNVCNGGTDDNKLCAKHSECQGSTLCNKPNQRTCVGGVDDGEVCDDFALSCASPGTCTGGPHWRVCEGGANDGKACDENDAAATCPSGTCTGPRLNFFLYYMSAGAYDFSPCSKQDIATYLAGSTSSCLTGIDCADWTRDGSITATDSLAALQQSVGLLDEDPLSDVVPFGATDLSVTASDASYILQVAIGAATAPAVCYE